MQRFHRSNGISLRAELAPTRRVFTQHCFDADCRAAGFRGSDELPIPPEVCPPAEALAAANAVAQAVLPAAASGPSQQLPSSSSSQLLPPPKQQHEDDDDDGWWDDQQTLAQIDKAVAEAEAMGRASKRQNTGAEQAASEA